ncbi:methylated-DNA--[protein]-cysteine S-methyltransferase [Bacillus gobiensis]|uniref:methylated-DNA--[protein]-cysteine S-methyltransferase n=1 Tax=Bacillus gobiensis TaxID=1441095 RepID=UPI003D1E11FE
MIYGMKVDLPIGQVSILETDGYISHLLLDQAQLNKLLNKGIKIRFKETELLQQAIFQLQEYFDGIRTNFTVPIKQKGTPFQENVWEALSLIPYGESRSYSDIALQIGKPAAVRAIGQANKCNQLPVFVPCHRVIGKNSSLTGYAGQKTDQKAILLKHENILFKEK